MDSDNTPTLDSFDDATLAAELEKRGYFLRDASSGVVLTPDEYDLTSKALAQMIQNATEHGQPMVGEALKRVLLRLHSATVQGKGVPDQIMARLITGVENAFAKGDYEQARVAFGALIAAVVRMETDPGFVLGCHLAPVFVELTTVSAAQQHLAIAATILDKLRGRLLEEELAFSKAAKWPGPAKVMRYIVSVVEYCRDQLQAGFDPFDQDEQESADDQSGEPDGGPDDDETPPVH